MFLKISCLYCKFIRIRASILHWINIYNKAMFYPSPSQSTNTILNSEIKSIHTKIPSKSRTSSYHKIEKRNTQRVTLTFTRQ